MLTTKNESSGDEPTMDSSNNNVEMNHEGHKKATFEKGEKVVALGRNHKLLSFEQRIS